VIPSCRIANQWFDDVLCHQYILQLIKTETKHRILLHVMLTAVRKVSLNRIHGIKKIILSADKNSCYQKGCEIIAFVRRHFYLLLESILAPTSLFWSIQCSEDCLAFAGWSFWDGRRSFLFVILKCCSCSLSRPSPLPL